MKTNIQAHPLSPLGGFTLIELVTVLVIVGVLAVVALPRFADVSAFEARGFHDETLALLRYAQKAAIAQHRTVCVTLNATGVALRIASVASATSCDTSLSLPHTPHGGTGLNSSVGSFSFKASGGTDQGTTAITLTITDSSGITIDPVTGYVY